LRKKREENLYLKSAQEHVDSKGKLLRTSIEAPALDDVKVYSIHMKGGDIISMEK
jgi:hypothetical protein